MYIDHVHTCFVDNTTSASTKTRKTMVANVASPDPNCQHGSPSFDTKEERLLHNEGLREVLKSINKYTEKGS